MKNLKRDPAWMSVQQKIGNFLSSIVADLGPRDCSHGKWDECVDDDCGFSNTQPRQGSMPMVTDWMLLMAVPDMNDPDSVDAYTNITAPGQREHVSMGLLAQSLFE